jgi:Co/Zn/Cd efflux system component
MVQVPGVVTVIEWHFWEQASDRYVGTLRVHVKHDCDEQVVKAQCAKIIREQLPSVRWLTIQIDKDTVTIL